ncbi:MFS transporter [Pandoraea sp. PE-S2T-3]|uniref:MFS transporter n=1 Tax=Pandoraea sp. PE-S2T-3 TaxID=1986993 RepID=UPI0020CF365D|nr:MFS transporter [Pandoraea sp. PE-S2T-3]
MSNDARTPTQFATTLQIVSTVFFTFLCYLTIGLPLAVLPSFVHVDLAYSSVIAGLAISVQYLATLLSRPYAGRTADAWGPKRTVLCGLVACGASGLLVALGGVFSGVPWLSLVALILGRLVLGFGESWVSTGAIMWGIGQVGPANTARVISWNGVATYGALALGAPLGVALDNAYGIEALGGAIALSGVVGLLLARIKRATPVIHGERLAFRAVLGRVMPYGMGLALGSIGFGAISTFITLYYASHHWDNAALALTAFGVCFMGVRLALGSSIARFGGYRVAMVSFALEAFGLIVLGVAPTGFTALLGAALAGAGFSLVFPSLGVAAVNLVPAQNRGAALGAYSVFLDVALGVTGPVAGLIVGAYGYAEVYLCAAVAAIAAVLLTVWMSRAARARAASEAQEASEAGKAANSAKKTPQAA